MKEITAIAFCLIGSVFLAATDVPGQQRVAAPMSTSPARPVQASTSPPAKDLERPQPSERDPRYRIQPGDTLSISFSLSPELDQPKVIVEPDGYVNMPDAGSVPVGGLTVTESVIALKKAYAGILHDPIIQVDLVDFQRPFFLVFGQVGKPGEYELRHETTVLEGIAIAGGFAPTGKTQVLLYHRVSRDWVEVRKLNIKEVLHGKNVNELPLLHAGDTIFVPEKAIVQFRKYIPYGTYVATNPTAY